MLAKPNRCGLIAALDTPDPARAEAWARAIGPAAGLVKLGLELFGAAGPDAVERRAGVP